MSDQWIRKVGLVLFQGDKGMDLSDLRIQFSIQNADVESPNTARIKIYNLSKQTINKIRGEYSQVVLNAGYVNGNYGIIFKGTIKQYQIGREDAINSYLTIFASDGDIGYNQGVVNTSIAKGTSIQQRIDAVVQAMPQTKLSYAPEFSDKQHIPSLRGKVLFGMARSALTDLVSSLDASWSIQNGNVQIIPLAGYLPGEAIKINVNTGLIGIPEQTDGGIRIRCLLNSKIRIGGLVELNNSDVVQLEQQNPDMAPVPYDQYAGIQYNAPLSKDGLYRCYVTEHEGDTRGNAWYSNLVCLAVKPSAPANESVDKGS